ncbi:MAG: pirin family protein [Acidiferrobacteraceae bacterium]
MTENRTQERRITHLVPAQRVTEGAGVIVHRALGTSGLRHLDPFLMLDHFSSDDPGDYIAGFPDHPHRGFITLTYMLNGHMEHRDSMGNRGDLRAGGVQWMKAASGVIHSEMPQQTDGLMRGFQLWINLPAAEKMSAPSYQEFDASRIPAITRNGVSARLLAGPFAGGTGPVLDDCTALNYLDISLSPGAGMNHEVPADRTVFIYVFDGAVSVADREVPVHHLAVLGGGSEVRVTGGARGGRLILVAGRPIREPIVQYGPFVMNTRDEIEKALADYREGRLVQTRH